MALQEDLIKKKSKATAIRKQRGLKFDDVSFMTSRRFYGKTSAAPSGGRRIEFHLAQPQQERTLQGRLGCSGELCGFGLTHDFLS